MRPGDPIYRVDLTEAEYQHLFRLAEEGVQAAMSASLTLLYPTPSNSTRGADARYGTGSIRAASPQAS